MYYKIPLPFLSAIYLARFSEPLAL